MVVQTLAWQVQTLAEAPTCTQSLDSQSNSNEGFSFLLKLTFAEASDGLGG